MNNDELVNLFVEDPPRNPRVYPHSQEDSTMNAELTALLQLPFHEYMAQRTKFAIDRAQRDNLIDIDHYFLSLLQATWARDYWINKAQG